MFRHLDYETIETNMAGQLERAWNSWRRVHDELTRLADEGWLNADFATCLRLEQSAFVRLIQLLRETRRNGLPVRMNT